MKIFNKKNFFGKFSGKLLQCLFVCGAPTLAKGPDSSYATFLTPKTHTILIFIIITLCHAISRNISL